MARDKTARAITVQVRTNRKSAEALRLGIARLAGRLGVPSSAVRVRRLEEGRR